MSPLFRLVLCSIIFFHLAAATRAATLSVSPGSMASDDASGVTLTVSGVGLEQTVLVERFHDGNGNGQVDGGDLLLLSFRVTDGKVEMFGGVRDEAVPGDEDGATNGQIRVSLVLSALPEANRLTGSYLFRVSALDGSFPAVVRPFVVVPASQGQTIRGTVTANGAPLPGAAVAALVPEGDGANFVAGVLADGAGEFVLNLPVGDYGLLGFKPGFVASFDSMPQVSLGSGASVTQAVVLSSAPRIVSGRVIDAVTSNGIAGLQLFGESSSGEVGLTHTDGGGNFSLGAGVGQLKINVSDQALRLLGYSGENYKLDTTAGDVSGVSIRLSKGRGKLELVFFFPNGSFGNGTNGLVTFPTQLNYYYALFNLEDVNFPTNVFFSGPSGSGLANTGSAIFGGNYGGDSGFYSSPQISVPSYPPGGLYTVNYKNQAMEFMLPDPQAQSHQVLLVPRVTLDGEGRIQEVQWERRGMNGSPVASAPFMRNIQIRIDGLGGRLYDAEVGPAETSHVPFSAVIWTNVSSIQMVYEDDAGNQYVCFWDRGWQPLQILTGTNLPSATVGSFYQALFVGAGGLTPYTWSLQSGSLPAGVNLGGTGELSGNPTQAGTYNFSVRVTDSNQQFLEQAFTLQIGSPIGNGRLEPRMRSAGRFELRISGAQAGQTYTVQYSTDLRNWFPLVTTNAPGAWFDVVDTGATDVARYYRISHP